MKKSVSLLSLILSLFLYSALSLAQKPQEQPPQKDQLFISTPEQIKEEFNAVPCKNSERLNAVKALFEKMGAPASEITIEKFKGVENLVVTKRGSSNEKIVVGAHYDKVENGCGAIDNWTGIVTLAHLYRSIKDMQLNKTIVFVAFGREEEGLVGSHAMAEAIKKEDVEQYCAMINIDSLGLTTPQVAHNMSSKKLEDEAAAQAKRLQVPFASASIANADSDSSSFIKRKIPALTLHAMTNNWATILHSVNDNPAKVNAESVYLGYRLALLLLAVVQENSCAAYR